MTNSITTITRERLEEVVSHIHVAGGMRLPEIQEMARALLAVMNAKPIGYFRDNARAVFRVWPTKSDDCNVPVYTAPPSTIAPDGWATLPAKLSADNGAKAALSGEFLEVKFISCPECFGDDDCDSCDGSGRVKVEIPVSWTTIKAIWEKGVQHFSAASAPGVD